MFEATTIDGAPINVRLPFWQCVKAGLGFTLGAALLLPVIGAVLLLIGGSFATLGALLSMHR